MSRNYTNTSVATELNGGVNDSTTSWTVLDGSTYPKVPFSARCELEVVLVTAKSGTLDVDWTVEREFDGTTGAAHVDGKAVEHVVIAADIYTPEWIRYLAHRLPDETAHVEDDFFNDEDKSDWTEVDDTGTLTWTESRDIMSFQGTGGTDGDTASILKSMGSLSAPVTIETAVRLGPWSDADPPVKVCPVFASGTTFASDNFVGNMLVGGKSTVDYHSAFAAYGALASWSIDQYAFINMYGLLGNLVYLRTIWTATNTWSQSISFDGVNWDDQGMAPWSQSMTPTHFGLLIADYTGSEVSSAAFEYFRVYEADLDV